ncbi:MAG: ABC transporter permease [Peptococcaceae bacterium]|jgi:peptide/nickel transport system permease protein|nr:ABC transporter permease [Peptococcaceae bacterium]
MFSRKLSQNHRQNPSRLGYSAGAAGFRRPDLPGHPLLNARQRVVLYTAIAGVYLLGIFLWGLLLRPEAYAVHYAHKFMPPGVTHLFGADFMGRDMLCRCVKGLANSLVIGLTAALISSGIGVILGVSAALTGGLYDKLVLLGVDCCMGLPHLVLLILISFMLGRGARGVMLGIALTHWPELTRLIRAEVLQLREALFTRAAAKMGKTGFQIAREHILPHIFPVYIVGLVLLFPHAIMHEAAITFLGFGLPAETPAIGVILSEAMGHLATGKWWLALFPGLMLAAAVILFDVIGENLKSLLNPISGNE